MSLDVHDTSRSAAKARDDAKAAAAAAATAPDLDTANRLADDAARAFVAATAAAGAAKEAANDAERHAQRAVESSGPNSEAAAREAAVAAYRAALAVGENAARTVPNTEGDAAEVASEFAKVAQSSADEASVCAMDAQRYAAEAAAVATGMSRGVLRAHRAVPAGDESTFYPLQSAFEGGVPTPHHDLLIAAPRGVNESQEYYRVPVTRTPTSHAAAGEYVDPPELMNPRDFGQRKVNTIRSPGDWNSGGRSTSRGPAFSTLPVKHEPAATSCAICYLIDTRNVRFENSWTAEEWSSPDTPDRLADPLVDAVRFEALLAGPRGRVFRIEFSNLPGWEPGETIHAVSTTKGGAVSIECLDLQPQAEIWNQLRNGTVVGRSLLNAGDRSRVIPLVNITSLMDECEETSK